MSLNFEELDSTTRKYMLEEFEAEQNGGNPYRPKGLSSEGLRAFPNLIREAIRAGADQSLARSLRVRAYWNPTETYIHEGSSRERKVNVDQAAERLAVTEFNTWYVRGLSKRLLAESVERCQAYRAARPKWEPGECSVHEGQVYSVK